MSRIINRQRQLAEQGRIRLGYTTEASNGKTRPVRSETFILSSHSRSHVENAAAIWGGTVEDWQPMGNGAQQYRVITQTNVLPAILPPGDPLTQAYEQWSKGGCQRRCDGATEQFSGSPCLCLAEHGEQWFELGPRDVCVSKSRLRVLLPDMEGLGSWRMETGSFYATDEIAGMVDTIRGAVGDSVLVPVTLRIEPRTRISEGKTKHFVVPVLELRGVTAGALLSGEAQRTGVLASGGPAPGEQAALESGPAGDVPDLSVYHDLLAAATTSGECMGVYEQARDAGLFHGDVRGLDPAVQGLYAAIGDRGRELSASGDGGGRVPGDEVGDPDAVWQMVLAEAGRLGWGLTQVAEDFEARYGMVPGSASAGELAAYLLVLRSQDAA